jgi:hypothetical protein
MSNFGCFEPKESSQTIVLNYKDLYCLFYEQKGTNEKLIKSGF